MHPQYKSLHSPPSVPPPPPPPLCGTTTFSSWKIIFRIEKHQMCDSWRLSPFTSIQRLVVMDPMEILWIPRCSPLVCSMGVNRNGRGMISLHRSTRKLPHWETTLTNCTRMRFMLYYFSCFSRKKKVQNLQRWGLIGVSDSTSVDVSLPSLLYLSFLFPI